MLFETDFMTSGIDRFIIILGLGFIEEWFASPATAKITYCLWLLPKRAPWRPPHHTNEIWQVRSGLENLSQQGFVKPVPSLLTVSQSHQISLFAAQAEVWQCPAQRGHTLLLLRAVTSPKRRRWVAFPWGTIKRCSKFHFVVTTGCRNCISCIRWSRRNIQGG